MRPIDFVIFDGDSDPNAPTLLVSQAMMTPIKVLGPDGQKYAILSYYLDGKNFVLDVEQTA